MRAQPLTVATRVVALAVGACGAAYALAALNGPVGYRHGAAFDTVPVWLGAAACFVLAGLMVKR